MRKILGTTSALLLLAGCAVAGTDGDATLEGETAELAAATTPASSVVVSPTTKSERGSSIPAVSIHMEGARRSAADELIGLLKAGSPTPSEDDTFESGSFSGLASTTSASFDVTAAIAPRQFELSFESKGSTLTFFGALAEEFRAVAVRGGVVERVVPDLSGPRHGRELRGKTFHCKFGVFSKSDFESRFCKISLR